MRFIELPVAELAARYRAGEGSPALARAYGVSKKTICSRLREVGVTMRPGGPPLGSKGRLGQHKRGGPLHDDGTGYLRTRDREGRVCGIHRACWEAHYGSVPDNHDIHHADGNRWHNVIENLVCMSHAKHTQMHHTLG